MKKTLFFILALASLCSFAKVSKSNIEGDLKFRFEMPQKEIQRSLASKKVKKEKTDAPRDPASAGEVEDQLQKSGIKFWKF